MTEPEGWTPLRQPRRSSGDESPSPAPNPGIGNGLIVTPFTRLARVHALSVIGDGCIAVALAGSIFFSIDPSDARWRVALYLVLTIAPFAIVTPLLGPAIDRARGGRRGMIIGSLVVRALLAFFMARHIDSLLLFPEAFAMLVLQKAYGVSRTALVPAVVPREEELIQANSKLALISSIGAVVGGTFGVILIAIFGNNAASTILAVFIFGVGAIVALALPQVQVAADPVDDTERLEVRGANIVLAATAIAIMRGISGFTTFLLAFHLRAGEDGIDLAEPGAPMGAAVALAQGVEESVVLGTPGPPQWHFGVAGLAAGLGVFLGAKYAPMIRDRVGEERIVFGALLATTITAFLGAWGGGITGIAMLAFGVAVSAATAKLGFDALVQRDAPRTNYGRQFAKFEGRFQLFWAFGAFLAVVSRIPIQFGALLVAIAAALAAVSYELGRRTDRVQESSRLAEAIRSRMPPEAVEKIGSNKAVQRLKPLASRMAIFGEVAPDAGDPTNSAPAHAAPANPALTNPAPTNPTKAPPTASPANGVPSNGAPFDGASAELEEQLDPTLVQMDLDAAQERRNPHVQTGRADDTDLAPVGPIDRADWSSPLGPQVSGDGVWVSPTDPPTAPGDDGQYRLWD